MATQRAKAYIISTGITGTRQWHTSPYSEESRPEECLRNKVKANYEDTCLSIYGARREVSTSTNLEITQILCGYLNCSVNFTYYTYP